MSDSEPGGLHAAPAVYRPPSPGPPVALCCDPAARAKQPVGSWGV